MPCTTLLVGKAVSYDGSTMMARNEDSGAGAFMPKKFAVIRPEDQMKTYTSVISKVTVELPENPMRYTAMPNAVDIKGIWGEAGFNEKNVAMTETETITTNPRVLGADPLVKGGIGEEDFLTIVLPYINSAREGVLRLGALLEKYGTYEMNGVGFQDHDEIWWLESIGGHHWIAKRVPDDCYVVMPNQQGIDRFDFSDAYGDKKDCMCSSDMLDFIKNNHLNLSDDFNDFDVRAALGSHSDSDHSYNTPRAWYMHRYFRPDIVLEPEADDLPWQMQPNRKITPEDVKYVLSSHYQGTKYDPYGKYGDASERNRYRTIGINRTNFMALTQLRRDVPEDIAAISWLAVSSNAFNAMIPFYANIDSAPDYLANTTGRVTSENFYWVNRIIAALADAHYKECAAIVDGYALKLASQCHALINEFDKKFIDERPKDVQKYLEECNSKIADIAKEATEKLLNDVLFAASLGMKNVYSRSDA